jgi:ABC-type transporter Mla MlaB component
MSTDKEGIPSLRITGAVTLYEVKAVREQLLAALGAGGALHIDLSESGPWDVAGLQLLIASMRTASERGQPVSLNAVPTVCTEIARRSGLLEWLRSVEG